MEIVNGLHNFDLKSFWVKTRNKCPSILLTWFLKLSLFENNVIFCILSDQFEDKECAVCLKSPEIGDITHKLPCAHKFHKNCIVEWLKKVN